MQPDGPGFDRRFCAEGHVRGMAWQRNNAENTLINDEDGKDRCCVYPFRLLVFAMLVSAVTAANGGESCINSGRIVRYLVSLYFVGDMPVDALKHLLKYLGSVNPQA